MGHDAYVKDADRLLGLAADLRGYGNTMAGCASRLSEITFMKESELQTYVNRIEIAMNAAQQRLDEARYEYDHYMHYTDEEDFSQSYAYSLEAEVDDAECRCREIGEDLEYACRILEYVMMQLDSLRSSAGRFSDHASALAETAAANIEAAAFEITQYKEVR